MRSGRRCGVAEHVRRSAAHCCCRGTEGICHGEHAVRPAGLMEQAAQGSPGTHAEPEPPTLPVNQCVELRPRPHRGLGVAHGLAGSSSFPHLSPSPHTPRTRSVPVVEMSMSNAMRWNTKGEVLAGTRAGEVDNAAMGYAPSDDQRRRRVRSPSPPARCVAADPLRRDSGRRRRGRGDRRGQPR